MKNPLAIVLGIVATVVAAGCKGAADSGGDTAAETGGQDAVCTSTEQINTTGTFFVISQTSLAADPTDAAACTSGSPYLLTFAVDSAEGAGFDPFFDDSSVAVADNGSPAHDGSFGDCDGTVTNHDANGFDYCDGIQTCFFVCPLCYTTAPTDLAVAAQNSSEQSAAVCVLP